MIHRRHRVLPFLTLVCGLSLACSEAAVAQTPKKKRDPALKTAMKDLKKASQDRKKAKDRVAIELIASWLDKFGDMHKADKADFTKGLGTLLNSNRVKRKPAEADLFRTAIRALGECGEHGSKHLVKAFENKGKFKDKEFLTLKAKMLENIGRTKDPKQIDFLVDVALKHHQDTYNASAGGALQHFADLPLKKRRPIAKDLIKRFAEVYNNANKNLDPGDANVARWKQRLAAVSDPWNTALQKLTKQNIRSANNWNTFWNKYKSANWDKPLKKTRKP